jgi:hypothetical protein
MKTDIGRMLIAGSAAFVIAVGVAFVPSVADASGYRGSHMGRHMGGGYGRGYGGRYGRGYGGGYYGGYGYGCGPIRLAAGLCGPYGYGYGYPYGYGY